MHLIESHNLYPDCISLEVKTVSISKGHFDLYVNLNFNEQWKSLLNGQIKFGIKGGKLQLKVENGSIDGVNLPISDVFTVMTEVSQTHPSWRLALKTSQWVFKGSWNEIKLGTLKITEQPCHLTATFAVSPSDISITDAEGLWKHNISPNKHGVLERKIALFLWKNKFNPYLSRLHFGSDEVAFHPSLTDTEERLITPESLGELQKAIEKVFEAKTHNFIELARLIGLNPLHDFAGGNFVATDLSGVELSGANLYHANFRGAVLTDIQLNEADLNHAKLSGVDLSGAYLGNANLSYCDLHNASLALANLIGADLRKSSLKQVNLSQTNLSGAQVEGAQFGDNMGLSWEMKANLQAKGAIFENS